VKNNNIEREKKMSEEQKEDIRPFVVSIFYKKYYNAQKKILIHQKFKIITVFVVRRGAVNDAKLL
jgi:hypothetical protein